MASQSPGPLKHKTPSLIPAPLKLPGFRAELLRLGGRWPLPILFATILLLVTVTALSFPVLASLIHQWWHDPDYSYGFLVPLLAGWMLWRRRQKLKQLPFSASWWGLPIILCGTGLLIIGVLGAENYISRIALLVVVAGLAINFLGFAYFRVAFFSWLVLFLMIPLPAIISNRLVLPLQFLASGLATDTMDFCGIPVYREGNVIYLPSITLEVAEACSGIRSLLAMITLAVAYGYLLEQKAWKRLVLVLAAIPIAVLANSLRVVASGVMGRYWGRDKAEGFFHLFSGLAIFCFSVLLLWALHASLQKLWKNKEHSPA